MGQPFLQSVSNALSILELFNGRVQELSLTHISNSLNLGKSTTHRLLSTMMNKGFIEQNPENGRYSIGLKVVHVGANKLNNISIIQECRPILELVSETTGESTHLSLYNNGQIIFVDKVVGVNLSIMSSMIGYRLPAYATASGKIFLAHMSSDELENFLRTAELRALTPHTLTKRQVLLEELENVRKNGFSKDNQESDEGLVCFAAPVFGRQGKLLAAVSVSGALSRMNAQQERMVESIVHAAHEASGRCGWDDPKTHHGSIFHEVLK